MTDKEVAIKRSKENWKAVEILTCSRNSKEKLWNAASSRLYYAILHLIFAEMSCQTKFKMGSSTHQHKLARDYMKQQYRDSLRTFKDVENLRIQADYSPLPVSEIDFMRVWTPLNNGLYNLYLTNLQSACERIII